MFNSQEFNLLSQSFPTGVNFQQRQIAERKTLPSFINEISDKEKNDSNLNLTFTFVPTAKHFEEEKIESLPPLTQNTKKVSQYQKQKKSYIIKPKINKKIKKGNKASKKSSKSSKNSLQISMQSKESSDMIKEESSQTSVDESDDDNTNASHILPPDNVDISRNELAHMDLGDKDNLNLEELENGETLNVVLYNIKIVKILNTETNSPYALFTIEGENDTFHVLHYDNLQLNKEILNMLSSGKYIQCKLLQKTVKEKGISLFRRKLISYSLIEIINA